jgi:non-ribosomal peptide synthetase component F
MAEALPQSVALDYYAQYPSSRLEETYASSEVQGTNAFLSTAVPRDGTTGRFKVRAGQGAVLLDPKDPSRKVEAIGEVGELLLVPTAGGYLNSEQTKQRFIPNPFGPGQLFRTGDLCSWVDAETLKIEGRVDFQVKVSGQLVALEQVEAAAEALDGIKAAAARTFVRASGTTAIALYLAGDEKMGVDGARTALAKKLPSYAIPLVARSCQFPP